MVLPGGKSALRLFGRQCIESTRAAGVIKVG